MLLLFFSLLAVGQQAPEAECTVCRLVVAYADYLLEDTKDSPATVARDVNRTLCTTTIPHSFLSACHHFFWTYAGLLDSDIRKRRSLDSWCFFWGVCKDPAAQ